MANTIQATFGLDISPLRRAATQAASVIGKMSTSAIAVAATTSAAFAGIAVAMSVGVKKAYDLGGALKDAAAKTGIAVDQMMILQQAAKDSGIEDVTGAVNKMQSALVGAAKSGAGPAAEALALLGLRASELLKLGPVEQFQAIGKALAGIKNPTLRGAIVKDIFGKSGGGLLPLLNDSGALADAQRSIGKQAGILARNAEVFDAISDRLNRSGLKLQGFFVGAAAVFAPTIDKLTAAFDKVDLAEQGKQFAEFVTQAAETLAGLFSDPKKLVQGVEAALLYAAASFGNAIVHYLKSAAAGFSADLLDTIAFVSQKLGITDALGIQKKASEIRQGVGPMEDRFGAGGYLASLRGVQGNAQKSGQKVIASALDSLAPVVSPMVEKKNPFENFRTLGFGGGGGLTGATMAVGLPYRDSPVANSDIRAVDMSKAFGGKPLLSAADRRAFENANGAAGATRTPSTPSAYGAIARGDAARRKNAAREAEKERLRNENSVAKSNELLTGILDSSKRTAEALE